MRLISDILFILSVAIFSGAATTAITKQPPEYADRKVSQDTQACHTIKSYQYGTLLGDSYSGGVGLPNDLKRPTP